MQYSAQLQFKEQEVSNNLKRIGKVEAETALPILGNEDSYFYRNKMEFSFSSNRMTQEEIDSGESFNKNALGFHKPGTGQNCGY